MSSAEFSLNDRVAFVTGGNGGLGRAMALGLKKAGAIVVISGRDHSKNEQMVTPLGGPSHILSLDVGDDKGVRRAIETVVERFSSIDILVNNAGISIPGSVLETSEATWEQVLKVNLTGSFSCAKHAASAMVDLGRGGKIINVGSMYSIFGPPNVASYAASKTGVLGMTRALAVELGPHDIQVNAILPGWYETSMTDRVRQSVLGEEIRRKTPAGRWGQPEDVVGLVVFLASRLSDFITGAAIPIDGGYAIMDRMSPP